MTKKHILITGSTDGIGWETAKLLAGQGQVVHLHGRNQAKLDRAVQELTSLQEGQEPQAFLADLSDLAAVEAFGEEVLTRCAQLDVLINNAGVFKVPEPRTDSGLDARFVVNTLAPLALTRRLVPRLGKGGRVINLSSAAQAPVDLEALRGAVEGVSDNALYAQSKLAITMVTRTLADILGPEAPVVVAVNPGSFLGTKMVQEAYGSAGSDIGIGAGILARAALSEDFAEATGQYFDNDAGRFAPPHPDALDPSKTAAVMAVLDRLLQQHG